MTTVWALGETPFGAVAVAARQGALVAVHLGEDPAALEAAFETRFGARETAPASDLTRALRLVEAYIKKPSGAFELPLLLEGSAFRRQVWAVLQQLKVGERLSYTALAERLGAPKSARAVAQACGANDHAVIIPCHRILGADGALRGYRWGLACKEALLASELELSRMA